MPAAWSCQTPDRAAAVCLQAIAGQPELRERMQVAVQTLLPLLVNSFRLGPASNALSLAVTEVFLLCIPFNTRGVVQALDTPCVECLQVLIWRCLPSHEWLPLLQHLVPDLLAPLLSRSWVAKPVHPELDYLPGTSTR